jgi:hypothetical protein
LHLQPLCQQQVLILNSLNRSQRLVSPLSRASHLVLLGLVLLSLRLVRPLCLGLHLDSVPPLEIPRLLRHQPGRHSDKLLPRDKHLLGKHLHLSHPHQLNGVKRTLDRLCPASVLQLSRCLPLKSNQLSRLSRCRRILARSFHFQGCRSARVRAIRNRKREWG